MMNKETVTTSDDDQEYEKFQSIMKEKIALNDGLDIVDVDTLIVYLKASKYYEML